MRIFQTPDSTPTTEATPPPPPQTLREMSLPEWIPQPLTDLWQAMLDHPSLAALGLVVVGWLVGKIAVGVLARGVARLTSKTRTEVDDKLIELLQKPAFNTVFLLALALAVRAIELPPGITMFTVRVLYTLIVLSWLAAGLPAFRVILDALARHRDRFPLIEERTIPLFDILSKLLLVGGISYAILLIWNINPGAWLASAGVIGIAVGFAARDTLANLFAGFFIVADAPYQLGDFVTLDSGERGVVTHVGIRSTRLLTRDDIEVTMPNAVIANSKIINESGGRWEKERIRIKVGVAYGSDVDQVVELLEHLAVEHDHICPDPAPRVRLRGFGDSSLNFELLCWIDEPVLRGKLSHELYMDVYKALAREDIEIPFPQRDIWVRSGDTVDAGDATDAKTGEAGLAPTAKS